MESYLAFSTNRRRPHNDDDDDDDDDVAVTDSVTIFLALTLSFCVFLSLPLFSPCVFLCIATSVSHVGRQLNYQLI